MKTTENERDASLSTFLQRMHSQPRLFVVIYKFAINSFIYDPIRWRKGVKPINVYAQSEHSLTTQIRVPSDFDSYVYIRYMLHKVKLASLPIFYKNCSFRATDI